MKRLCKYTLEYVWLVGRQRLGHYTVAVRVHPTWLCTLEPSLANVSVRARCMTGPRYKAWYLSAWHYEHSGSPEGRPRHVTSRTIVVPGAFPGLQQPVRC